jgi:hypothetical protein
MTLDPTSCSAGGGTSRNHGISESAADWLLFLDDDVDPEADILLHFAKAIRTRGQETDGFVGTVQMSRPCNGFTRAVALSHLTYWYGIARRSERVAWGTTANIAFCRTMLRFGDGFPKTGKLQGTQLFTLDRFLQQG